MAARLARCALLASCVLACTVSAGATSGCSWATVQRPPPNAAPSAHPGCTTSGKPITVDGAFALSLGIPGFGGLISVVAGCQNPVCFVVAFAGLVGALPFALSADYGRRHIGQCRELDLTWRARERAREEARDRAKYPGQGGAGAPCRPESVLGRCDPGLACRDGRCAPVVPARPAPEKPTKTAPASAPATQPR